MDKEEFKRRAKIFFMAEQSINTASKWSKK
jgi:hypothetical protein